MCIPPVPVTDKVIALYVSYLARRLKPGSIRQYVNVIRLIHLECGLANPMEDSWYLQSTLRGIQRIKGSTVKRKLPVTPALLLQIRSVINLNQQYDAMFWSACLFMFYGTFRKSNLFPDSVLSFSPHKQFSRRAIKWNNSGFIEIEVGWSKTIQFKDRCFIVRMPCLSNHVLCPVSALCNAFMLNPVPSSFSSDQVPAFVNSKKGPSVPITGSEFNRYLKLILTKVGVSAGDISSHSFRRGSATWALSCGIPGEIVKCMGDWKSVAYLSYVDHIPQSVRDFYMLKFASALPNS